MTAPDLNHTSYDRPHRATERVPDLPTYFVCSRCNVKWFARKQAMPCPRCFLKNRSEVRLAPPWWRTTVSPPPSSLDQAGTQDSD